MLSALMSVQVLAESANPSTLAARLRLLQPPEDKGGGGGGGGSGSCKVVVSPAQFRELHMAVVN